MKTLEHFKLKGNPFRITPTNNDKELIWAGFSGVKQKIENCIKRAIQIPNSNLVLNWGAYGSGKTHAAKYFLKQEVMNVLTEGNESPLSFLINFPKGKDSVKELYTGIIDKLDINGLREKVKDIDTKTILSQCTDNYLIKNILVLLFDNTVSASNIKAYLYGNVSIKQSYVDEGIQRKLESDSDYTEFLAALFSFLTYNKKTYSCIILWIDEFEDISTLNSANINKMNNFIRTLMDKVPNNLLIFMNLTQSAMMSVDDLGDYLQEAVKDRIKTRIELQIPNKQDVIDYLEELLNNEIYRLDNKEQGLFPFDNDVVNKVIDDLGESVSLRKYNEIFSSLLEHALYDNQKNISIDYYNRIKDDIIF